MVLPELVCMDIAVKVNIADAHAGRKCAASVPCHEFINLFCALGVNLFQLHVKIRAVHMIINGEDILLQSPLVKVHSSFKDYINCLSALFMGKVVLSEIAPPPCIHQMIKACPLDAFLFIKAKDIVQSSL